MRESKQFRQNNPTQSRDFQVCQMQTEAMAADRGTEADSSMLKEALCRTRVDKSLLAISEPKRIRSKDHLRYVASKSCLVCGRTPSHAHHVRFAQSRGVGLKVSDEFTVPLCAIHHSENHSTGDERKWWQERKIDPLGIAHELWRASSAAD
jgi:hypothetical protein